LKSSIKLLKLRINFITLLLLFTLYLLLGVIYNISLGYMPILCIFVGIVVETGSCCVAQAGLALLGSSDAPSSASQIAGTVGVCQHAWLNVFLPFFFLFLLRASCMLKNCSNTKLHP
jgi:hypothetical protein